MNFNINLKNDYSYLFQSMNTSANSGMSGMSSILSDYSSIKNGSYGKLLKAYYAKDTDTRVKDIVNNREQNKNEVSAQDAEKLNKIRTESDSLQKSAGKLLSKDKDSVFNKMDKEAIYQAVDQFVNSYNSVLSASKSAGNESVSNRVNSMVNETMINKKALGNMGITIGEDNTLSLNKETFEKADMNSVKSLFNGNGSYGYHVSAQAGFVNSAAEREASKASSYTGSGKYNQTMNIGNLFNGYF